MLPMNIEKQPEETTPKENNVPSLGKHKKEKRNGSKIGKQIEFRVSDEVAAQLEEDKLREEGKFG